MPRIPCCPISRKAACWRWRTPSCWPTLSPPIPATRPRRSLAFEAQRRRRAARVQTMSRLNGRIYHARPPLSWARDAVLRAVPGAWLMAGYDWLYGWRADAYKTGA